MRHLSGSRYKLFLQVMVVCVLFFWGFSLFAASPRGTDADGARSASGLGLLSLVTGGGGGEQQQQQHSDSDDASKSAPPVDGDALQRLEAEYARERQERLELQRDLEQLQTKQQDLQGQLDILRQQIPLPEEQAGGGGGGGAKVAPPEIGYTKWAKNYYNTRRDGEPAKPSPPIDSIDLLDLNIDLPRLTGADAKTSPEAAPSAAPAKTATATATATGEDGGERSEGDRCVLPRPLDYTKDFWGGRGFAGCCPRANCNKYQLRDKGRLLLSKCEEEATVAWGEKESRTIMPNQLFALSGIPQGGSLQYVTFTCKRNEELVVVPMTNEQAYKRVRARNATTSAGTRKPNVVVMMIDAVSRPQFIRALPNTIKLFDTWSNDAEQRFSVFDFKFFGTLGAYSPPNRYAFFSGYPFVDGQAFFEGSPFPEEQKVLRVNDKKGVWMWDVLSEQGYITYSARDMCSRIAAFVYDDFVSRPWTDVHFQEIYCDHQYRGHASSSQHCLKTRLAHQYVLDSGYQFHETYYDVPHFAYLDFAEGHEPSMRVLRTMDSDLVEQLPRLMSDGNTVVVLASDHGIGYGKHHVTKDGPLEERLPALYVIAPNKILTKENRINLERNTEKLVNGLDVFETVADLAGAAGARPWAHSLLQSMPSRTCKEAGINVHACPCTLWDGAETKSRIAWK